MNLADEMGASALHWAVVGGSQEAVVALAQASVIWGQTGRWWWAANRRSWCWALSWGPHRQPHMEVGWQNMMHENDCLLLMSW